MNILFVTPPPYLPNRLHRIRAFELIKILAKKHKAHLFCVVTEDKVYPEFKEIKRVCESVKVIRISKLAAVLNCLKLPYLPLEVAYCYSDQAKREIKRIIKNKKIDLVYVKRLRSMVFMPDVDITGVVDTTDAMSLFYKRLAENNRFPKNFFYKLEAAKYKNFENMVAARFKNWIVSSSVDEKYLEKLCLSIKTYVIPNPIDTNYFKPSTVNSEPNTLLLSGLMDKPVNVDAALFFAKKILPLILKKEPSTKLIIVGPKPSKKVRELADGRTVFVEGFVADIREFIVKCQIAVAPVRIATGVRNKILQSWAIGRPVVSTTIGAQGLIAKNGENIELGDSPSSFAQKVVMLLKNKRHYNKLAKEGQKTVFNNYSHEAVSLRLKQVLDYAKKQG